MAKRKDPAFLFYPGDFVTGTQFFTDEQVGKYIRLLMAQHQHGHLPEKHMILICGTYDIDVFSKFIKDSDGKYYNERLEDEIFKRKKYTESRANNRSSKNDISETYVPHMENKDKDINKEPKEKVFSFNDSLKELGATDSLITDWMKVRKKKSATNSETAFKLFKSEYEKSKLTINQVLIKCIEKDWKGFNAEWVMESPKEVDRSNGVKYPSQQS